MTSRKLANPLLATSLALCLLAACSPAPTTPAPEATPDTAVKSASTPVPSATPTPVTTAVGGAAGVLDKPFAGADVAVYRLGQKQSMAVGKTDETGHFIIDLGGTPLGVPVKVVATKGNQVLASIVAAGAGNIVAQGAGNIVAQGGGNIVAQGGGNIVAQGGGNIVAQGGGNIVAQGGGNIVAQGGGNIVAQGGGNNRVLAVDDAPKGDGTVLNPQGLVRLNLATTTAVAILSTRLEAYAQVADGATNGETMLDTLRGLATELYNHEADIVSKAGVDGLLSALDTFGVGQVSQKTGDAVLAAANDLAAKIESFVAALDKTIAATSQQTGKQADQSNVGDLKLGSQSLGTLDQHVNQQTTTNTDPAQQANGNPSGGSGGATNPISNVSTNSSGITVGGTFSTSDVTVTNPGLNVSLPTGTAFSSFFSASNVSLPVKGHATVIAGSKIYVIGGQNGSGTDQSAIWSATINGSNVIGSFTQESTSLPAARSWASVAYDSDKIYVIGGQNAGAVANTIYTISLDSANNNAITGITTDTTALAATTNQRTHAACAVDNSIAYMFGGTDGTGAAASTVQGIYLSDFTLTTAGSLPDTRIDPAVANLGGTWVVTGGSVGGTPKSSVFTSTVGSNTWSISANTMVQARSSHQMVVYNNDLVVFGGHAADGSTLSTAEGGTPTNGFQILQPGLTNGREGFTASIFNTNRVLLLGGQRSGSIVSSGEQSLLSP